MAGNVERHLLAIDRIEIELGGDDCLPLVDRFDDIFPVRPDDRAAAAEHKSVLPADLSHA